MVLPTDYISVLRIISRGAHETAKIRNEFLDHIKLDLEDRMHEVEDRIDGVDKDSDELNKSKAEQFANIIYQIENEEDVSGVYMANRGFIITLTATKHPNFFDAFFRVFARPSPDWMFNMNEHNACYQLLQERDKLLALAGGLKMACHYLYEENDVINNVFAELLDEINSV